MYTIYVCLLKACHVCQSSGQFKIHLKLNRTKQTKIVFYVQKIQNEACRSDRQILYGGSYEKPVSTD